MPLPPKLYKHKEPQLHIMSDPEYANTRPRSVSEVGQETEWMEEVMDMGSLQQTVSHSAHIVLCHIVLCHMAT